MQRHMKHVQFTEEKFENSCCDCPSGNREVGVWSHGAAAIWFFGYQYYSNDNLPPHRSSSYLKHLDDSEIVDDFVESFNEYVEILYSFPSWTGNKKYKSVIISFSITTQILKSLYYIIWILFWAPLNTNVHMTTCRTLSLTNFGTFLFKQDQPSRIHNKSNSSISYVELRTTISMHKQCPNEIACVL